MTTTPYLSLYTTSATTSGTIRSGLVEQTMTGAASANMIEAFKVKVVANVQTGNWCNALMGKIDYSTSGFVTGLAGVVCAELSLPASNAASAGGDYSVYEAEIDCPTSCDMGSRPIIVFEINSWGGAKGEFDDNGYLFDISGVTSGSDHFYYDNTSNAADAFLRCRINGATYYMPLSDSTTFA
jgi:hypothetical protein